jgi:hypothetical protein
MATNPRNQLQTVVPPRLPAAPVEYSQRYGDDLTNILRLYFNQLSNGLAALLAPQGGRFLNNPYGSFYDTTDQTAANTTTAYAVTLNATDLSNGVTVVSSSRITFGFAGIYNIQFSVQLTNDSAATQDIDIWFAKNGTNIANSNTRFGLAPRKSAGDPYHVVGALNFVIQVAANDYVQLFWRTSDVAARIEYYAASTTPTRPAIPSVILTATFVSSILT